MESGGDAMNDKPCKNCGSFGGNVGCDVCGPPIRKRNAEERIERASETLLPCPFCGGKAVVMNAYDGHGEEIRNEFMVRCYDGCGCQLDNAAGSPQAAAKDWNIRHNARDLAPPP